MVITSRNGPVRATNWMLCAFCDAGWFYFMMTARSGVACLVDDDSSKVIGLFYGGKARIQGYIRMTLHEESHDRSKE